MLSQSHRRSILLAILSLVATTIFSQAAEARVTKVLMITGDWKSQAWYQDVWMGGKQLYRGRFIASKVNEAAPGQFQFTDITNYIGQQYVDSAYLSQFDVVLMADTNGWSLPDRFLTGLRSFVRNGGGFIYCASYKWHTATLNGTPFEEVLPTTFLPVGDITADWQAVDYQTGDKDFKPVVAIPNHPILAGLDWTSSPPLAAAFQVGPKPGADVLLKTPTGKPILVAWNFGRGRSICSSSIFANDEVSPAFGQNWKDFGKYYANVFRWLGANSTNRTAKLQDRTAQVTAQIDFAIQTGPIHTGDFSIHAAHDDPGLAPLSGVALENFQALHPEGTFSRMAADCEPEEGKFNFTDIDKGLAEMNRLHLEPIALFAGLSYGQPKWIWANTSYAHPTDRAIAATADEVAGFLQHVNGGKRGDLNYKVNVRYIEIGNEPKITSDSIDGYCKIFKAVAERVHHDFPGVKVGGMGGYEIPYLYWFIDRCGPDIDWISRHPYGWTGEMLFKAEDEFAAYARKKGLNQIQYIVTEWDYWIAGRPKFDYMMKRYFEAVKRPELLGTLHYRLGEYTEGGYLFGVLWTGMGQDKGAGAKGTPMHDTYDALWSWRNFRGHRVSVTSSLVQADDSPQLLEHLPIDASRDGDRLSAVLYYDWAYDGTGFKDYGKGINYPKVNVRLQLSFPPANRNRTLSVSRANGEGISPDPAGTKEIVAGQTTANVTVVINPVEAVNVSVE